MIFSGQRLLFLGAHPDDIELGCGALIAHIGGHADLRCVTLSDNQKNPALKNVVEEHYRSMAVLGVEKPQIILKDFETRKIKLLLYALWGRSQTRLPLSLVFRSRFHCCRFSK